MLELQCLYCFLTAESLNGSSGGLGQSTAHVNNDEDVKQKTWNKYFKEVPK